jgi:sirohydrochlorin ferrochelatase
LKSAILIVDHGSRLPEANDLLRQVAERVRAESPPGTIVRHAHMEIASPDIGEGLAACVAEGAAEVIVHPYFLAPGRHSTRDIPRLVEEAARRHPGVRVSVSEPLGLDDRLARVVLERVRAARAAEEEPVP